MKIPAYIHRNRYGIYHFRRVIPTELRCVIGKRELTITLKTRDPKIAVQLARKIAIQVDRIIAEAQMGKNKSNKTNYGFELELPDGTKTKAEAKPEDVAEWKKAGLSPEQITDVLKSMSNGYSPSLASQAASHQTQQPNSITISELINRYKDDYRAREGKDIINNDGTALRRLSEIMGKDTACTDLTIEVAHDVRDVIMRLPKNSKQFDGMHILKITEMKHEKTLAPITVASHIKLYSRLLKWAKKKRYYFDEDLFEDLIPRFKRGGGRDMFTNEELAEIFSGQMFTSYDPSINKPHHYWAPLISLFTGARTSEIGALRLADIKQVEGLEDNEAIWIFDFNTHGGEDRMKTKYSERQTPIHPKLIELGLLNYRQQLIKSKNTRLFDYLNKDTKGSYGRWIGADFTNYLKSIGLHQDTKKVFHSFRHTIATALERADVSDPRIELICGRSSSERPTTGRKHYISPADANYLLADLMKVDFSEQLKNVKLFRRTKNN